MATRTITQQDRGTGSGGRQQQTSTPSARSTSTTRASSSKSSVSNSSRPSRSQSSNRATAAIMKPPSSLNDSSCSSPTNPDQVKKIPPIKAPVGLAKGPDLTKVRSKIGSLENVKHRPAGGEKKAITQKLEWKASSRIGSLENAKHKPGGGELKVTTQKLEWKVQSKVGSLDNVKHKPGGGQVQIFDEKYTAGQTSSSASPSTSMITSKNNKNKESGQTGDATDPSSFLLCKPSTPKTSNGHSKGPSSSPTSRPTTSSSSKPIVPPKPAVRRSSNETAGGSNVSQISSNTSQRIRAS